MKWRNPASAGRVPTGVTDIDLLPLAVVRLDPSGRILQLSDGWTELGGHDFRDCIGCHYTTFLHPGDLAAWQQTVCTLAVGERPHVMSQRHLGLEGERIWVEVRIRALSDGLLMTLANSGDLVRRRERLQASHRSLSNLLDSLPMMVYRCRNNRNWTMEYVSAGCTALTGYLPRDLMDNYHRSYASLIHPDDRDHVWAQVQIALQDRQPFSLAYRLLCADGSLRRVAERGIGIWAGNGEVLGLEGVIQQVESHQVS